MYACACVCACDVNGLWIFSFFLVFSIVDFFSFQFSVIFLFFLPCNLLTSSCIESTFSLSFSIASPSITGLSRNKWDPSSSSAMACAKEYIFSSFSSSEFKSITSLSSSESESLAGVFLSRTGSGVSVVDFGGDWMGVKFWLVFCRFLLILGCESVSSWVSFLLALVEIPSGIEVLDLLFPLVFLRVHFLFLLIDTLVLLILFIVGAVAMEVLVEGCASADTMVGAENLDVVEEDSGVIVVDIAEVAELEAEEEGSMVEEVVSVGAIMEERLAPLLASIGGELSGGLVVKFLLGEDPKISSDTSTPSLMTVMRENPCTL